MWENRNKAACYSAFTGPKWEPGGDQVGPGGEVETVFFLFVFFFFFFFEFCFLLWFSDVCDLSNRFDPFCFFCL